MQLGVLTVLLRGRLTDSSICVYYGLLCLFIKRFVGDTDKAKEKKGKDSVDREIFLQSHLWKVVFLPVWLFFPPVMMI